MSAFRVVGALLAHAGEIGIEIGVERHDLGDIPIELMNQGHVLRHIVRNPRLVVLVHLLNQKAVTIQHRLHLPKALVERRPRLGVAFSGLLHLAVGVAGGRGADGGRGGGGGMVAAGLLG